MKIQAIKQIQKVSTQTKHSKKCTCNLCKIKAYIKVNTKNQKGIIIDYYA